MVVKLSKAEKKVRYDKKLCSLLDEYGKVLITAADNVGSNQLQSIRRGLRGDSVILMGKNTLIRCCICFHTEKTGNKDFLNLLPLLVGNVGLIFTKGDLKEVSEEVAKYKVASCFFFSKASNDFWRQIRLDDDDNIEGYLSFWCHAGMLSIFEATSLGRFRRGPQDSQPGLEGELQKKIFRCLHFQADDDI
ncbi:60S acidic ribosomal protein P0-like [Zingiber officinale]|uniref:60S acidic ribosomal protein P0-like n=1 Tax=Zingiber officinale TaxID=94328 RepID=UPI001C4B496E|nr:60S acidic ribosomal protein P0-like [Zingiber officinale]